MNSQDLSKIDITPQPDKIAGQSGNAGVDLSQVRRFTFSENMPGVIFPDPIGAACWFADVEKIFDKSKTVKRRDRCPSCGRLNFWTDYPGNPGDYLQCVECGHKWATPTPDTSKIDAAVEALNRGRRALKRSQLGSGVAEGIKQIDVALAAIEGVTK